MKAWGAARAFGGMLIAAPVVSVLLACGGTGSFPVAEPCVEPSPTPTPRRNSTNANDAIYARITSDGLIVLENFSREIRGRWPNDEPSNRVEFRQDYVDYVRDITCLATDLKALSPRGEELSAYDTEYDLVMDETIALAEFGRDAVKARNSSKYRQWSRDVDAMPLRYIEIPDKLQE